MTLTRTASTSAQALAMELGITDTAKKAKAYDLILALLTLERERAIPEGWKLVPIIPTQAMIDAGKQWTKPSYIYDVMLEAAPAPPQEAMEKEE